MTDSRRLRYVSSEKLKANGCGLCETRIAMEGDPRPLGALSGVVIDVDRRRVRDLVIKTRGGAREIIPLEVTHFNRDGSLVIQPQDVEESTPFEPSAYGRYDEDAVLALMFGSHAA